MKYFWLSWYQDRAWGFELHHPFWMTGVRLSDHWISVCAAVAAETEAEAKRVVRRAFDDPLNEIEWRFCEPREGSPFSSRFQQEGWMKWPPEPGPDPTSDDPA